MLAMTDCLDWGTNDYSEIGYENVQVVLMLVPLIVKLAKMQ